MGFPVATNTTVRNANQSLSNSDAFKLLFSAASSNRASGTRFTSKLDAEHRRTTQFVLDYIVCKRAISCGCGTHTPPYDWLSITDAATAVAAEVIAQFIVGFSAYSLFASLLPTSSPFAAANFNHEEIDFVIVTFVLCHLACVQVQPFSNRVQSKSSGNLPAFRNEFVLFLYLSTPRHPTTERSLRCDVRCEETRKETATFWWVFCAGANRTTRAHTHRTHGSKWIFISC